MKIHIGTDHAGYDLKENIKQVLTNKGYEVIDCGAFEKVEDDDYPDFVQPVAKNVAKSNGIDRGIVLGGSGQGEAIVANRTKGVRAVVYYGGPKDIITLSRQHNDANILSIGARFVSFDEIVDMVLLWLTTDFSNEIRHKRRIEKIDL
jgi:ribose 5-phosphate isomerase B